MRTERSGSRARSDFLDIPSSLHRAEPRVILAAMNPRYPRLEEGMRRFRWIIGICLTFGLITAAGPVAFAGTSGDGVPPGGNRVLRGKTSQGQKIMIVMNRIGGGWGLQELDSGALLRCQDGTRTGRGGGRSWC